MSIIPVTISPKKLAQTISSTATSFKLNNIQRWDGQDLTPADFGTEAYCVFINSSRTQIEIFKFDPATIADASITIIARGLPFNGGDTPDISRQYAWTSNDTVVQLGTDAPQLFRDFVTESNTALITALHTYDVLPQSAEVPVNDEDFTTKQYVDGLTQPRITVPVNQTAHGFVEGDIIRLSGIDTYTKAQADSPANAEVIGIVVEVVDVDNFKYATEGIIEVGVPIAPANTVLFLSRTTPGALVTTDTTTIGEVSFPLAVVTQSSVRMVFHKYRPAVINTISGNPVASETVAGMVEQATPAQVTAKTDIGETGAPLFVVPSLIPDAYVTPPRATVYLGANQAMALGTAKILIDTELYDPDNLWASSTFTAPEDGQYRIDVAQNSNTTSGSTHWTRVHVYKNGGSVFAASSGPSAGASSGTPIREMNVSYSVVVDLVATDTIEFYMESTVSGNILGGAAANQYTITKLN